MKQTTMEPRKHKVIIHHAVTPVQVHNRSRAAITSVHSVSSYPGYLSLQTDAPPSVQMQSGEVKLLSFQ